MLKVIAIRGMNSDDVVKGIGIGITFHRSMNIWLYIHFMNNIYILMNSNMI